MGFWEFLDELTGEGRTNRNQNEALASTVGTLRSVHADLNDLRRQVQDLSCHLCALAEIVVKRLGVDAATMDAVLERYRAAPVGDGCCPKCGRPYGRGRAWCVYCGEVSLDA